MIQTLTESASAHFWEMVGVALTAGASCVIPVMIYIASVKRSDRKANAKLAEVREEEQNRRHSENQKALEKINKTLEFNPPHIHIEDDDGPSVPLTSGGIRYGPKKI